MSCMTLFAEPMAMATTQLVRIHHADAAFWQAKRKAKHKPLNMSWVVVTEQMASGQLSMLWVAIEGC
jgi:hypothetical protein